MFDLFDLFDLESIGFYHGKIMVLFPNWAPFLGPKAGEVRGGAAVEGMGWEPLQVALWGVFGTKGPWKS